MGFRLPKKTLRLVFDGTEYEGAEVTLNLNVKLGYYFDAAKAKEAGDMEAVFAFLADTIVAWNLEDDDGPIPIGMDGVRRLDDIGFVMELLSQWEKVVQGAVTAGPLSSRPSNAGAISGSPT